MSLLTCENCLKDYPTDSFPRLDLGMVCINCIEGKSIEYADKLIENKTKQMAKKLTSLSDEDLLIAMPKLKSVVGEVYSRFGGPEGFAQKFYWLVQELIEKRPSVGVGHLMLGFLKLHHNIEQTDEQITARQMSDDQLKRELELETIKLVIDSSADPEKKKMLEAILGRHGLKLEKLTPSEEVEAVTASAGVDRSAVEEELAAFLKDDDE